MIHLVNGYVIDADVRQYRLRRLLDDGAVDTEVPFTYYSSLEGALKGAHAIMKRNRLQKGDYTLKEAMDILTELDKRFEQILFTLKENHVHLSFSDSELGRFVNNFEYDDGPVQSLF